MKNAEQLLSALDLIDEEYNQYDEEGLMTPDSGYFWGKHGQEQEWIREVVKFLQATHSRKLIEGNA